MTEDEILARLAIGEKIQIEDPPYLSTIRRDKESFWVEAWPVPGVKLEATMYQCRTLAEALLWVIGEENITWK